MQIRDEWEITVSLWQFVFYCGLTSGKMASLDHILQRIRLCWFEECALTAMKRNFRRNFISRGLLDAA